jgi:multidrug resistance efflux pump
VSNQINNKTNGSSSSFAVDFNELQQEAMSELRVDVARYRKLAKRVVKDESLRGRYKTALTGAQNKVEASSKRYEAAFTQGRGTVSQGEEWEEEQVDGSAAALLVDTLLEAGGLIPLSKR